MAKLLSNRVRSLNVGISSFSEGEYSLQVTGITSTSSLVVGAGATINGLTYPTSDGTNLQVLSTDGLGTLTFQSLSALSGFGWANDADFGLITESVVTTTDNGTVADSVGDSYDLGSIVVTGLIFPTQFVLPSVTVASLPSVNPAGQMLFVTDETGGSVPAFSDGTNWRRLTDRQIVS